VAILTRRLAAVLTSTGPEREERKAELDALADDAQEQADAPG
jgi:hypothetical protein